MVQSIHRADETPCAASTLAFEAVTKTFPGVTALDRVSFEVRAGSVHGLVGENGAGKSTLLRVLSGAHAPTSGTMRINGVPVVFTSTHQALAAGVAVIYQELHLVPTMSVAENIYLGHLPRRGMVVDRARLHAQTRRQLERVGEDIDPRTPVDRLPIAQRQMVEIAKALTRGARIIAFDEPTSSLSAREVERLFTVIRELKQGGCVILYVSHRFEEIFRVCDAVTVLRDGRHVAEFDSLEGVTRDALVQRMVGREIADIYDYRPRGQGAVALEVSGLTGPGLAAPCSFSAARGEILGIFGLVGAGRTELLRLLYGAVRATGGAVRVDGRAVTVRRPEDAINAGVVLCPEDRKRDGIIPVLSVRENINVSARRHHAAAGMFIRRGWERRNADERIGQLRIKVSSARQRVDTLSGGNQQKTVLARWLSEKVRVLLLDEPTRGIDVGAKSEVYRLMYELAAHGLCLVLVSSELPEVLGTCDRIIVMRQGRVSAVLPRGEATEERVLYAAFPLEHSPREPERP